MGRRGPKRTPTAKLAAIGSEWANRPNRRGEVKPAGDPVCPSHLDADEKRVWKSLLGVFPPGFAAAVDTNALERYCVSWVRWQKLVAAIKRDGEVVTDNYNGNAIVKANPAVAIAGKLASELSRLEAVFGMTPSDRAGLKPDTPEAEDVDPFERLKMMGDKVG